MNESNIQQIKAQLIALGFAPSVDTMLRCQICFQPAQFELTDAKRVGDDQCHFVVHLQRNDAGVYAILYYTATLRKPVVVARGLAELDDAMAAVDWRLLAEGRTEGLEVPVTVTAGAGKIVSELSSHGMAADVLKYKYWTGTVLESLIGQISLMKSQWEISERFYFFDEAGVITFAEAIRFLGSRWMEKQLAMKRKLLVKNSEIENDPPPAAGPHKLLQKKKRRTLRIPNDRG